MLHHKITSYLFFLSKQFLPDLNKLFSNQQPANRFLNLAYKLRRLRPRFQGASPRVCVTRTNRAAVGSHASAETLCIQILATFPSRIYRREVKSTLSQRRIC